ncbi:DUF4013 domain-containing protein, partial [Methanobrevibacter sp. OttesenSCG-928-I08]|nr:DUF4013 domain-containing protein [Methanobrevibacter sp. OttesenSCG-928-I08]
MILEIYRDSLEYTFKDITILKIGILSILSILILPIIILAGYSYRTIFIGINSMINKNKKKPSFDNIKEMSIQGLKILIITFLYNLPAIIITYILAIQGHILQIITFANEFKVSFHIEVIAILFLIWFISQILTSVAIPYMVDNEGSLKEGLNIKKVFQIIKNVGVLNYIKLGLISIVIYGGITIILFLGIQMIISLLFSYGILMSGIYNFGIYAFLTLFIIIPIILL